MQSATHLHNTFWQGDLHEDEATQPIYLPIFRHTLTHPGGVLFHIQQTDLLMCKAKCFQAESDVGYCGSDSGTHGDIRSTGTGHRQGVYTYQSQTAMIEIFIPSIKELTYLKVSQTRPKERGSPKKRTPSASKCRCYTHIKLCITNQAILSK